VIHSDICESIEIETPRGSSYFISFIDDLKKCGYTCSKERMRCYMSLRRSLNAWLKSKWETD